MVTGVMATGVMAVGVMVAITGMGCGRTVDDSAVGGEPTNGLEAEALVVITTVQIRVSDVELRVSQVELRVRED